MHAHPLPTTLEDGTRGLRDALRARRPDLAALPAWPRIEDALRRLRAEAPGARVAPEPLLRQLENAPSLENAADLVLAAACAGGDGPALRLLSARLAPDLRAAARSAERHGLGANDLGQLVLSSVLAPGVDGAPRIAAYAGTGSLAGWLRVVMTRLVLDHVRKRSGHEAPAPSACAADALPRIAEDPEVQYLKRVYGREVERAFEASFLALDAEHKNLLRHRYVEGLSIDRIAASRGIHRATAARRVAAAEDALHADTRRRLKDSLALDTLELASVMRAVRSQLHVSVARLLS